MRVRGVGRGAALAGIAVLCCSLSLPVAAATAATGTTGTSPATTATTPATAATPVVTAATGGGGVAVLPGFTSFDPAVVGYERSEVFLSGTASAYEPTSPMGADGRYAVAPTSTAPYVTRAVVMRPIDPRRFNGTVVVEWLNVSGGADAAADWMQAHTELVRAGIAWVGVSAQKVGVDALRGTDPPRGDVVRYAGLSHPGDSYSYDIFSQAGQAIRTDAALMLRGLKPKHLLAVGESQSAGRMVTYIDAVHPLVHVYDGFLVHSRGGGGAPLSQGPQPAVGVPSPAPVRADVGVPVLVFQTETDVPNSVLGTRQPDSDTYRLWEVAGTAHYDYYGLNIGLSDTGDGSASAQVLASMQSPPSQPGPNFTCNSPINTGPAHYVLNAAFAALDRWVTAGTAPPIAPRLETNGAGPVAFVKDADGNVVGGIRTPALDAPVAALSGLGQGGNQFCFLFGTTVAFTPEQVVARYPDHRAFVSAWTRATNTARRAGFIVDADAKALVAAATQSDIGK